MQKKHILIVEDEFRVLWLMKEFLSSLGPNYVIETADSGSVALDKTQSVTWDLVITDNCMPGMSGLDLIGTIKRKSPSTLFILMTAYGSNETEQTTQRLGVYRYMLKPFSMADLKRIIADALPITENNLPTITQEP